MSASLGVSVKMQWKTNRAALAGAAVVGVPVVATSAVVAASAVVLATGAVAPVMAAAAATAALASGHRLLALA